MNKECAIKMDQVIISDSKGNLRESNNYDNIIEILEQENYIEEIENRIKECKKDYDELRHKKGAFKEGAKFTVILIIASLLSELVFRYGLNINLEMVKTPLGLVSNPVFVSFLALIGGGLGTAICCILEHFENKDIDNQKRGNIEVFNYLNKKLEEASNRLEYLNSKKQRVTRNNQDAMVVKFHDLKTLKDIDKYSLVTFNVSCNPKKYYANYQRGSLHLLLDKEKDPNSVDDYLDAIEEIGPRLIKDFHTSERY